MKCLQNFGRLMGERLTEYGQLPIGMYRKQPLDKQVDKKPVSHYSPPLSLLTTRSFPHHSGSVFCIMGGAINCLGYYGNKLRNVCIRLILKVDYIKILRPKHVPTEII